MRRGDKSGRGERARRRDGEEDVRAAEKGGSGRVLNFHCRHSGEASLVEAANALSRKEMGEEAGKG